MIRFLEAAALGLGLGVLVLATPACKDKGKASAQDAVRHVDALSTLTEKDVGEVERGLPEGATRLSALFAQKADARQDLPAVRKALLRVRREVPDLSVAKSTFFALADEKGMAIRNDLEQDVMAGQNLLSSFPGLSKAEEGAFVTTTGAFPGPPAPSGPDKDWVAASPVKRDDGTVAGILVTGWSFRRFAHHLQETLKHDLQEQLLKAKDTGSLPVLYVAVFDRSGVYSAPQTPAVNEKALLEANLVDKTAGGSVSGVLTITDRDFGYAAQRTPKLGNEVGIVVLRSEI